MIQPITPPRTPYHYGFNAYINGPGLRRGSSVAGNARGYCGLAGRLESSRAPVG